MNSIKVIIVFSIVFFLLVSQEELEACSMYKITANGKTMVGCNEDAWRTTSRIWFENAKGENEYGAGFTGSRQVSTKQFAPQSDMNAAVSFSVISPQKRRVIKQERKDYT